ncbi:hypothetical protein [Roseobacter denitrificans]|nr:hypothetical protein [Roseobacter denitrificans]SFF98114.1 hypothetical protein SAMN05443635_10546 [Roseobacter denitrificans OCh 114]
MIRSVAVLVLIGTLSACGVDGEPVRPSVGASVAIGSGGVNSNIGVGLNQGPFSIFLGL